MDEGPDTGPVADDRQSSLADQLHQGAVEGEAGARTVEVAVSQCDAFQPVRRSDGLLEIADRVQRLALVRRRIRVKRVLLRLRTLAGALVVPVAVALGDHSPDTGRARRLEEVVHSLGSQPV